MDVDDFESNYREWQTAPDTRSMAQLEDLDGDEYWSEYYDSASTSLFYEQHRCIDAALRDEEDYKYVFKKWVPGSASAAMIGSPDRVRVGGS